jgi:hypothetical protein
VVAELPSERICSESQKQYNASEPRGVLELDRSRFVRRGENLEAAAAGCCSRQAKRTGPLVVFIAGRCQRSLLEQEISVWHLDEKRAM